MKTLTLKEYRHVLSYRFGDMLHSGSHLPDGKACLLESYAVACGVKWTDSPCALRIWDLRPLNDMDISPELRAKHLPEVLIAYQNSRDWTSKKQVAVASRLAILIINRIVSKLPGLSDKIRMKFSKAQTCAEAAEASVAASAEASAEAAAWPVMAASVAVAAARHAKVARHAAKVAVWAAEVARHATVVVWHLMVSRNAVFMTIRDIFMEAAKEEGI